MSRTARPAAVFLVVALTLTLLMPAPRPRAALAQTPPPEAWPDGRGGCLPDLALRAPGATPRHAPAAAFQSIPDWERVVFQSLRDGNWEIYLAYGATQLRLTNNAGTDAYPSLNRGATRIAYAGWIGDSYEIYAMNADGSGGTRLTYNTNDDVSPAWSPDGSRIAFASYRDGQSEIYVMNADGSNPVRLTANGIWDGEPAWSPDGTQIAFSSYRDSLYRIWRMNADGSNQVQLSDQAYSENATWSPTGLIAFDADGNGDGWQEMWTMNADGSGETQVYDPPQANTDARVGSWSPDGRYVAYARVSWVLYNGQWYWTTSYLFAWDSQTGSVSQLISPSTEMFPDWQTADVWPPLSSVSPLRPTSPGRFLVSWSGYDQGPSGITTYDVQARDGAGGAWADWLPATTLTSAEYAGTGGHTYYFRCRARDRAGNVEDWPAGADALTTVEALAPKTAVNALPAYSRGEITVRWGGRDAGGSGIATYDVQRRIDDGAWTHWQVGTAETEAVLPPSPGHTVALRSRGIDRAGNVEAWPAGDGDASTSFYTWALTGTLRDNRDTPVMGGLVSLDPEALAVLPADAAGAYTAYEGAVSGVYTATWSKAGYGALPPTALDGAADVHADITLPPPDNAVLNWDFETGSLEPEWLVTGALTPTLTPERKHTGALAAALGRPTDPFEPATNVSGSPASGSTEAALGIAPNGELHAVWREAGIEGADPALFYARRDPVSGWSEPIKVSAEVPVPVDAMPEIAVASDGAVHVAFAGPDPSFFWRVYTLYRAPDGAWSAPVAVSTHELAYGGCALAVGSDGIAHLIWPETEGVRAAQRSLDGTWSEPALLWPNWPTTVRIAVTPDGTPHAVWNESHAIYYAHGASDGTWSEALNLSNWAGFAEEPAIVAAADGAVHVAWAEGVGYDYIIRYARRSPGGAWSPIEDAAGSIDYNTQPKLAVEPDGTAHIAYVRLSGDTWDVLYVRRGAGGGWSAPEWAGAGFFHDLRVDSTGVAHIVHSDQLEYWLLYARRSAGGGWSRIVLRHSEAGAFLPQLAVDDGGGVHVLWQDGLSEDEDILYARSARSLHDADSILSQALTVTPAAPTLSFWYSLEGVPSPDGGWLGAEVDDGQASSPILTATLAVDWTHVWADLSRWAGRPVTVRFLLHEKEGRPPAWATIDEVSAGSAFPDLWAALSPPASFLPPGQPVELALTCGNRGGAAASQVVLTDTLPPGLTFVAADPPPTTITPTLSWALGDLPPAGGPLTITLTLAPEPDLPAGQTLTNTVDIGSATAELETLNDRAAARLWFGWRAVLPLAAKAY